MGNASPRSSREHSAVVLEYSQQIKDHNAKSIQAKIRMVELRAQLEAAEKEIDENERVAEGIRLRKEASERESKRLLREEERVARQKRFHDDLSDTILESLYQTVSDNSSLNAAIRSINAGQADKHHYDLLKVQLVEELAGAGDDSWQKLARRIIGSALKTQPQIITSDTQDNSLPVVDNHVQDQLTPMHDTIQVSADQPTILKTCTVRDVNTQEPIVPLDGEHHGVHSDDLECQMSKTTPQQVPDATEAITNTKHESIERDPPSAKRLRMTEIEQPSEPMQLSFTIDLPQSPAEASVAASASPKAPVSAPQTPKKPVDRSSIVGNETSSKRKRDDSVSVDSGASTTTNAKQTGKPQTPKKATTTATKQFADQLENMVSQGEDIDQQLKCQNCDIRPEDPRLSVCGHLYCNKCVAKIRRVASKSEKVPMCVYCNNEIGKRVSTVNKEDYEEWLQKYTDDNDDEEEDGDGDEDDEVEAEGSEVDAIDVQDES